MHTNKAGLILFAVLVLILSFSTLLISAIEKDKDGDVIMTDAGADSGFDLNEPADEQTKLGL